jgi:hypothetical protein
MTSFPIPAWCPFRAISSAGEAAEVSVNCLFSLSTLETVFNSDLTTFALTEKENLGVWRWAIINSDGSILDEGRQPTQVQAKEMAESTLPVSAA